VNFGPDKVVNQPVCRVVVRRKPVRDFIDQDDVAFQAKLGRCGGCQSSRLWRSKN
jgi:hypothetical protein